MNLSNMYFKYITVEGDTFDSIALKFLNDEFKASEIINLNPKYVNKIIFESDIELKIPEIEEKENNTLPPWKR